MNDLVKYENEIVTMDIHDQKDINPWAVDELKVFLFFCCPECPDRCPSAESFVNHALSFHPQARNVIPCVDSLNNELALKEENQPIEHIDIKVELVEEKHTEEEWQEVQDKTVSDYPHDDMMSENEVSSDNNENEPPLKKYCTIRKKCMKNRLGEGQEVQCYLCSEMMAWSEVYKHIRGRHYYRRNLSQYYGEKQLFKCSSCNASLETDPKDGLHSCSSASHVEKVDDRFKCGFCSNTFPSLQSAVRHISTVHTEERKYQCENCEYSGKSLHLLKKHTKIMHEKVRPHVCDTCGKSFYTEYQMKKHQANHHNSLSSKLSTESVRLPCDHCDRVFFTQKGLKFHKYRSHHPDNSDQVGCEFCGKTFLALTSLKQHLEKEHASKEDIDKIDCHCEKCNVQFPTSVALNEHLTTCLDDEPPKNLKCDNCQEENWHSAIALKKHIAEEHGNIRDVCNICGVILKAANYLDVHKQNVHGVKATDTRLNATNIPCDKCGKVLPQDQLQRHILVVHENYRPFKCTSCDGAFATYPMLLRHTEAKHLKDTQYKCQQCNYTTFTRGAVGTHTRMVHEKAKPNKCDHCDMAFYYKRDKIKHMSKHHHD
jgi:hypothetical protein